MLQYHPHVLSVLARSHTEDLHSQAGPTRRHHGSASA